LNIISRKKASKIGLFLGPILFVVVIFIPIEELGQQLSFEARIVLATTLWMGTWWITEAIPIYVTALLPLVVFPSLNITELGQTSSNYADRVVFLFLGGFILAKAVEKSNLHSRFALNILKIFGTNPKYIVAAFMVVTGFLSAWMSNTATTMLMLPIAAAVVSIFHNKNDQQRFAVCLMLSVAYSASLGGMATLIGTPPNAILASLSKSIVNIDVTFGQWMLVGLPISGISLVVAWLYMINFGAKITHIKSIIEEKDIIRKKLSDLGNLNRDEIIVAGIFVATAIAWITRGLIWKDVLPMIDDSTIVIVAAISLFLIPSITPSHSNNNTHAGNNDIKVGSSNTNHKKNNNGSNKLLDWDTAVKIPWGVLLLIGGGLALANAFTTTGVDKLIAQQLNFLGGMHYFIIILAIVSITIFAGEIISNTATAALMIPISASFATTLDINPILLMVPITLATSYGFIMPVGTPPNAIVFASGHVTAGKMARAGLPLDIIGIVIVTALSSILVPLVWK
jgi:solute carrier family 13 (sodium-dependent dicarboxylate transporter), member 2/3/5